MYMYKDRGPFCAHELIAPPPFAPLGAQTRRRPFWGAQSRRLATLFV